MKSSSVILTAAALLVLMSSALGYALLDNAYNRHEAAGHYLKASTVQRGHTLNAWWADSPSRSSAWPEFPTVD